MMDSPMNLPARLPPAFAETLANGAIRFRGFRMHGSYDSLIRCLAE
jgi:hypothetical protein